MFAEISSFVCHSDNLMVNSRIDQNFNHRPLNKPVDSSSRLEANMVRELETEHDRMQGWFRHLDSASRVEGNLVRGLETGNHVMQERFRKLKAATLRAGLIMGRSQTRNINETAVSLAEPMVNGFGMRGMHAETESGGNREGTEAWRRGCKRKSSHLVAMALEMDLEFEKPKTKDCGTIYDCLICLCIAKQPILTCCGHLFCWACFCKLPYVDSIAKECPVCEGEVTDSNIVPIYGDGDTTTDSKLDSAMMIPPRPKAQRVESKRGQPLAHNVAPIPVEEALRRIRTSIIAVEDSLPQGSSNDGITNHPIPTREDVQPPVASQSARMLSDTAASLSSISVALNDADRLLENMETYINDHLLLQRMVLEFLNNSRN